MIGTRSKRVNKLAVLILDDLIRPDITSGRHQTVYKTLNRAKLPGAGNLFVVCKATQLSDFASLLREYNQKNKLKGLLIRPDVKTDLLPQLMYHAGVTTMRNTLFYKEPGTVQRILHGWDRQAAHLLIAGASAAEDNLYIVSCSFKLYTLSFREIPALRLIDNKNRADFIIDEDGSFIHWPDADIHLDIETLEYHTNEEYRRKADLKKLQYQVRAGLALKQLRENANLRQSHIDGLSARQVRRIENGESPMTLQSLEKFASALGMTVEQLIEKLADYRSGQ